MVDKKGWRYRLIDSLGGQLIEFNYTTYNTMSNRMVLWHLTGILEPHSQAAPKSNRGKGKKVRMYSSIVWSECDQVWSNHRRDLELVNKDCRRWIVGYTLVLLTAALGTWKRSL